MIKKNLIANYVGQGWTALMSLAFVPIYIKYLGIEAYGLIGLFAVLQACLSILDMGMTPTLSREMARFTGGGHTAMSIRDLLRSIELIALPMALVIAVGIALGAEMIANSWLQVESLPVKVVAEAFAVMGLVTALRFVEGVYRSCIIGLQRQVLFNVVNIVMATLRGLGAVAILVWVSPSIQAFFLWQGVLSIATLGVLAIATYVRLPKAERGGQYSLVVLRSVWRFAGGMVIISLLVLLLTQLDKILLSKLLTLKDYGYYTLAATVAGALYVLISPITQAYYPRFCELHASGNQVALAEKYHQGAQLVSVIAGSAAIVIIFFGEAFLRMWTQDTELAKRIGPLLSLLILGNLLNGMMCIPYQAQLAYGWTGLGVGMNIVAVAIMVPCILLVAPQYGAEGAAWVWVLLNASYLLIGIHFMYKRILNQEKWLWYFEDVFLPIAPAVLVALALKALWPAPSGSLDDFVLLMVGTISTLGTAVFAAKHTRKQILGILDNVWKKISVHTV